MIVRYGPYTKSKNSHDYKIWAFTKSKTTKIWALTKSKTIVIGHLGNYVVLFLVSTLTTSLTMMNNVLHTISSQNRIVRIYTCSWTHFMYLTSVNYLIYGQAHWTKTITQVKVIYKLV